MHPQRPAIVPTGDRRLDVRAFLAWEPPEPDRRYQLIDGQIVLMRAPALGSHNSIIRWLTVALSDAAHRSGLKVLAPCGVGRSLRSGRCYEADLAVTAEPLDRRIYRRPVLVAEVLSPSTEEIDRKFKLPDYRSLPSVREILLIDQFRPYVEWHRRGDAGGWSMDLLTEIGAALDLTSVPARVPLADLYRGIEFGPPPIFAAEPEDEEA